MHLSVFFLGCIVLGTSPAHTQEKPLERQIWWLDASAGLGAVSDLAYTFTGEARLQKDHQILSLRLLYSKEVELMFPIKLPSPREQQLSASLLYGRTHSFHLLRMLFPFPFGIFIKRETDFSVSTSLGIGGSWTLLRGAVIERGGFSPESSDTYAEERKFSYCVPLEMEIVQYVTPSVGYVHRFYYNFGGVRNPWGFLWGIQVGLN